jgi:hypothetical protein
MAIIALVISSKVKGFMNKLAADEPSDTVTNEAIKAMADAIEN